MFGEEAERDGSGGQALEDGEALGPLDEAGDGQGAVGLEDPGDHPAAQRSLGRPVRRVLVLGGGDGLAARELLRYPSIVEIVLVDLDPAMTDLARKFPLLTEQNGGALSSSRLRLVNDDAMHWLDEAARHHEASGKRGDVPTGR